MRSLILLVLFLVIVFFIIREMPRAAEPRVDVNPGWAVMRYDGPWYGERLLKDLSA